MHLYSNLKRKVSLIPKSIRIFAIKAIVIFVCWQLIYLFILQPDRIIDKPLTRFTAESTATILEKLNLDSIHVQEETKTDLIEEVSITNVKSVLYKDKKRVMGISDGCNGLSICVLFVGFIIAFPSKLIRKIKYSISGVVMILLVNIIRTTALALLILSNSTFTNFAHHYLYKLITYTLIFCIWILFTKREPNNITENA